MVTRAILLPNALVSVQLHKPGDPQHSAGESHTTSNTWFYIHKCVSGYQHLPHSPLLFKGNI